MKKEEIAKRYFRNSFNCAQSVLVAFGPEYGFGEDQCLKVACAFGAGLGRQQLICGAVTGALMALGLKYGKGKEDPESNKKQTYNQSVLFIQEFRRRNKSINCRELLLGLDMNDDNDLAKIKELGLFDTLCHGYVTDAVLITEKLMADH